MSIMFIGRCSNINSSCQLTRTKWSVALEMELLDVLRRPHRLLILDCNTHAASGAFN
jgi:hypothetical protein